MGLVMLLWGFSLKCFRFLVLEFEISILFFPCGHTLLLFFFCLQLMAGLLASTLFKKKRIEMFLLENHCVKEVVYLLDDENGSFS